MDPFGKKILKILMILHDWNLNFGGWWFCIVGKGSRRGKRSRLAAADLLASVSLWVL